jgi:hypothetical protein
MFELGKVADFPMDMGYQNV